LPNHREKSPNHRAGTCNTEDCPSSGQLRTPSFFSFKDIMKGNKDDQCGIMVKNFNLKTWFHSFIYKPEADTKKSFFLLVNVSETTKTLSFNFFRFQT
jgi:hypothetical protein